jgi:hypoxanthine phosphoribosyltransferase
MSENIIEANDTKFEVLISKEKLRSRVNQLARQISIDYKEKVPIFVGVLNGAVLFLTDLIRALSIDCEIDFIKISSYGNERISSGAITMIKDFSADLHNRDIIVVEDIVDSGLSVKYLKQRIEKMKPASLKFVSLLVKKGCAKVPLNIDYVGFQIENKFVVGYGLDLAQKKRNLNSIYKIYEKEL